VKAASSTLNGDWVDDFKKASTVLSTTDAAKGATTVGADACAGRLGPRGQTRGRPPAAERARVKGGEQRHGAGRGAHTVMGRCQSVGVGIASWVAASARVAHGR
jgi:hypothetical protein